MDKKTLFFSAAIILFFVLAPLHFAQAQLFGFGDIMDSVTNKIINGMFNAICAMISFVMAVIVLIISFITTIVSSILTWLIGISLNIPITNTHIVKDVGWPFCRDLVNLGFLLVLAWIGLSVILRISQYNVQKTLPMLLLIALLVNFSLVLVGFVVDIGNLITNFFLNHSNVMNHQLVME